MQITLGSPVGGLAKALGDFFEGAPPELFSSRAERPERATGLSFPTFVQRLSSKDFYLAFEPGSRTHEVLANDQNRFSPPRSLPPVLEVIAPDDDDNPTGDALIVRHAYSDGAFALLEELLVSGFEFSMHQYLDFTWQMAQALAFLHGHAIVHGQWNARSICGIPQEQRRRSQVEGSPYRFEVFNSGVCFRHAAAIPKEYIDRGYYPHEVFLGSAGVPDYHAIDCESDVYCFSAFLKDVAQRACSTEELPTQAARLLEDLQKEANPRGWKASPEKLRQKELEILDHLYTIRLGTESIIQMGLRDREHRARASELLERASDLHEKAALYLEQLRESGFEPVNVFGDELQHYTAFKLEVTPGRINNHEDSTVILTGSGLPHDLVRVTLNERHRGVHLVEARPGRVEFQVSRGFPIGTYKVSINNRRTNGNLEVFAPSWMSLEPERAPLPWAGFENLKLRLTGDRLPDGAVYSLRRVNSTGDSVEGEIELAPPRPAAATGDDTDEKPSPTVSRLELVVPDETEPACYELFANGISTGLRVDIDEPLPDPRVDTDALEYSQIKNYRSWSIRLGGHYFHPRMKIDLGESTPPGFRASIESTEEAILRIPAGFPAGSYTVRVNYQETPATFEVLEPAWTGVDPRILRYARKQEEPVAVGVRGRALPPPSDDDQTRYSVWTRRGEIAGGVIEVEEVAPEEEHRVVLAPDLPRGRLALRFGEANTGLELDAKRPLPRSLYAGAGLLVLLALTAIGAILKESYAPRIESLTPQQVFSGLPQTVTLEGKYTDAVSLIAEDGTKVDLELSETETAYRLELPSLEPGEYRIEPVGPLYSGEIAEPTLAVIAPELRVEPLEIHRHVPSQLRVTSSAGFPLDTLQELRLEPAGGESGATSATTLRLDPIDATAAGSESKAAEVRRRSIVPGELSAEAEGEYRVVVNGIPVASPALRVKGARIDSIEETTLTLGPRDRVTLTVVGENLLSDLELGLRPKGASEYAFTFEYDGVDHYHGQAVPGTYELGWVRDATWLETLPGAEVTFLPPPVIDDVAPRQLEPGRPAALTFHGLNLAALDSVLLRPTQVGRDPVRIELDPTQVTLLDGVRGSYRVDGLTLESGNYVVEPADESFVIEVFDDCRKLLDAFAASGDDPESLIACLNGERPPLEVRERAAELLYHRGHFEAARNLYAEFDDPRSKFRAALVATAVLGESSPVLTFTAEQATSPYAQGAVRLGFADGETKPFDLGESLPWDLEFVVGWTSPDPNVATSALRRSIEKRAVASGGHSVATFEPAWQALAEATFERGMLALTNGRGLEAQSTLGTELLKDGELWSRLPNEGRVATHFWLGHIALWYHGDDRAARASWTEAITADSVASATGSDRNASRGLVAASRAYLAATRAPELGEPVSPSDGTDLGPDAGWIGRFLDVYRYYREISEGPNFNLLTERYDFEAYLTPNEREKSVAFHKALRALEADEAPTDPLAHHALLYYLRSAQKLSWPAQEGGRKAERHRQRLVSLSTEGAAEPVRAFYVAFGELDPLDSTQISVLPAAFKDEQTERLNELTKQKLPEPLEKSVEALRQKLTGGSRP